MLGSVQAAGVNSGWHGVRDSVTMVNPLAYATDEDAKSCNERNDALSGSGRGLAGTQGYVEDVGRKVENEDLAEVKGCL